MKRTGRLNTLLIKNGKAIKTCTVKEAVRPNKLLTEKTVMETMLVQGVNVPRVLAYYRNDLDQEVLEMEFIDGRTLARKISQQGIQAFKSIGSQLSRVNSEYNGFGWVKIEDSLIGGVYDTWREFLLDYFGRYGKQVADKGIISQIVFQQILTVIESEPLLEQVKSQIIHRDVKPGNIIMADEKAYLIDWENAILGDKEFDLAVYRSRYGEGKYWRALLAGYGKINERLNVLYQIIALVGLIDFSITYNFGVKNKLSKLNKFVKLLGVS